MTLQPPPGANETMSIFGTLLVVACFVAATVITWTAREVALRRRLLDQPNARSAHTKPKPRVGGVGIVVPFLAAGLLLVTAGVAAKTLLVVLGATAAIAVVGLVDDVRPLTARVRFAAQVAAAVAVLWVRGPEFTRGFGPMHGVVPIWLLAAIAVLWIVWFTNLFNFMDGIDGLAGGQTVIAMVGIAAAAFLLGSTATFWLATCLAAAALGFLVFNLPPSTIFMGDVGSTAVGFFLASIPFLPEASPVSVEIVGLSAALFALDATTTLLRRLRNGERVFEAHRTHCYQRPLAYGVPHRTIMVTAYAGMVPVALAAATYPLAPVAGRFAFAGVALLIFGSLAAAVRRLENAAQVYGGLDRNI